MKIKKAQRSRRPEGLIRVLLEKTGPAWFDPAPTPLTGEPWGAFPSSFPVTDAGDVRIVPLPGHSPGHLSVIVQGDGPDIFLAGDTSYTLALLRSRKPDGVSPRPSVTLRTMDRILAHASRHPTVYLPSHDPDAQRRLGASEELRHPNDRG